MTAENIVVNRIVNWNYVVVQGEDHCFMAEVYYDEDRNILAYIEDCAPMGDDLAEMIEDAEHRLTIMKNALEDPTLIVDYKVFEDLVK